MRSLNDAASNIEQAYKLLVEHYRFADGSIKAIEHLKKASKIIMDGFDGTDISGKQIENLHRLKLKNYISPTDIEHLVDEMLKAHAYVNFTLRKSNTNDDVLRDICLDTACNVLGVRKSAKPFQDKTVKQLVEQDSLNCSELALLCGRSLSGIWN